jgi:hypothetical protein
MRSIRKELLGFPLAVALALGAHTAWPASVTPEDQKLIDAASCDEIVKQYGIHVAEEKAVVEEIKRTTGGTVATNVIGAATLAAFGFGFFTWDNSVDAEENLAELRAYRDAIGAAGRKKGCAMPAQ